MITFQLIHVVVKEDMKSTTTPLLPDSEELNDACTTPRFGKGNKFYGVPLSDSVSANSPRFANKLSKKTPFEKLDLTSDTNDDGHDEGDCIVHHYKRQVRADRRMLMVLYQELNEERSASAVAANNSMAMITRLQAEKASIEMEALQYHRMMEEQAEYDQEAIQILKDMLIQKEKDINNMEIELESYRNKYGVIKKGKSDDKFKTETSQLSGMLNDLENLIESSTRGGNHDNKDRGSYTSISFSFSYR